MKILASQLQSLFKTGLDYSEWTSLLNEALPVYGITTLPRIRAFLAQVGHESGGFRYSQEIWGPTKQQLRYECNPKFPWDATGVNRLAFALGNIHKGDGSLYRGRGLIQITGRAMYKRITKLLRKRLGESVPDFEKNPQLLREPKWAVLSACEFWDSRGLNTFADNAMFKSMTKRINGGFNGLEDRERLHSIAKELFK